MAKCCEYICTLKNACVVIGALQLVNCAMNLSVAVSLYVAKGKDLYGEFVTETEFAAVVCLYAAHLIAIICYIVGVFKDNTKLMIPWLVSTFVLTVFWTCVSGPEQFWKSYTHTDRTYLTFMYILSVCILWTIFIVGFKHYRNLLEAQNREQQMAQKENDFPPPYSVKV